MQLQAPETKASSLMEICLNFGDIEHILIFRRGHFSGLHIFFILINKPENRKTTGYHFGIYLHMTYDKYIPVYGFFLAQKIPTTICPN